MYGDPHLYRGGNPFFIETIAAALGVPAAVSEIKIAVYKHAKSGVWIKFDDDGVIIGVNVPSNGEYSERIDCTVSELLVERFWTAIANCDNYASE